MNITGLIVLAIVVSVILHIAVAGKRAQDWIEHNIVAEGWQDSEGFHYGARDPENSKTVIGHCRNCPPTR